MNVKIPFLSWTFCLSMYVSVVTVKLVNFYSVCEMYKLNFSNDAFLVMV